jgi:hypothetical protein
MGAIWTYPRGMNNSAIPDQKQGIESLTLSVAEAAIAFNLTQRETILNALEDRAHKNPDFAARLATARARQGAQSFEGLFVKNLENVQGDERDHMIISTTFGENEEGKFRRSFGPLSKANGGRRLNVLVTRAREMVHVVTSIPRSEYIKLYDLPPGSQPNGRLLLYEYLKYVERMETEFKEHLKEAGASAHGMAVRILGLPRHSL